MNKKIFSGKNFSLFEFQKFKNKKALEDSLATWIIVLLIIVFLMFIYVGVVYVMGGIKTIFNGKDEISISSKYSIILTESLISFLNSQTEFNGEKILVKELIAGDAETEKEKFSRFKELSEEFADFHIIEKKKSYDYNQRAWLRIYDSDDEIKVNVLKKYSAYEVKRGKEGSGGNSAGPGFVVPSPSCNPDKDSAFSFFILTGNKKVAICTEYLQ